MSSMRHTMHFADFLPPWHRFEGYLTEQRAETIEAELHETHLLKIKKELADIVYNYQLKQRQAAFRPTASWPPASSFGGPIIDVAPESVSPSPRPALAPSGGMSN